jgi:hypothetical protein
MVIVYRWRYDATYYRTVTDRYYRQLPFVSHLPTQFTLVWLLMVAGCWYFTNIALTELVVWALVIGAIAIPSSVLLTKKAIFLKYRVRPSFDSEACYSLSDSGGTIQQHVGETRFPWSTYVRAVRFPDGILLLRKGAIRWLPDRSLEIGSVDEAMALVRSKLPLRVIA